MAVVETAGILTRGCRAAGPCRAGYDATRVVGSLEALLPRGAAADITGIKEVP